MGKACTTGELESFIRADVPGAMLTYYLAENAGGYDGLDKALHGHNRSKHLGQIVTQIRKLANAGQVDLVQERVGLKTRYRAIWRARVRPLAPDQRLTVPA
jgi:hypothetical protein